MTWQLLCAEHDHSTDLPPDLAWADPCKVCVRRRYRRYRIKMFFLNLIGLPLVALWLFGFQQLGYVALGSTLEGAIVFLNEVF